MKREVVRKIQITITTIIMLLCICYPPVAVYAGRNQDNKDSKLISYTQLLLSLNGFYSGPISGKCNTKTQKAIEKQIGLPAATPSDTFCRKILDDLNGKKLLEDLNGKLTTSMSTSASGFHDLVAQSTTGERNIASEIDKLKSDLSNNITTVNGINEGMSTRFSTLAISMYTIGTTSLLAGIALIVAFLLAFINIFVPTYVERAITTNNLKQKLENVVSSSK
jgi:hypothetical protein